jgi:cation transport ATPase
MEMLTGESIPYNVVGNDSLYAIIGSSTDNVTVEVQRV